MSAFLGPIHFWLYNKIKIQNEIIEEILDYSENNLSNNMRENFYTKFGDGELKPLDQVIDVTNIHGWLQERVNQVESKLAYVVTELTKNNPNNFDIIKDIFKSKGAEVSIFDNDSSLDEVYKAINDTLLDGMPCDHANSVILHADNEIVWKRNLCVHQKYWDEVEGDIKDFYRLRDEFIEGLLSETDVKFEKLDETTSKISK
jgi:hypothetical protein